MRRALLLLALLAAPAQAEFPDRPFRLIVGYAPGGSTDIIARTVAEGIGQRLGQQVVVENRGGAGGVPAAAVAVQNEPDGYTLVLHTQGLNQAAAVGTRMPFHPVDAWAPIGLAATGANALIVHPAVPATTMVELQAFVRASGQPLRFGTPGIGLSSAVFAQGMQVDMEEVRYRGTSAALADLLAGRVQAYTIALAGVLPYVQSGQLRALAIGGPRRSRVMPELPTTAEAGFPTVLMVSWFGLVTLAGTPEDRLEKLFTALNATLAEPQAAARLEGAGLDVDPSPSRAAFGELYRRDFSRWMEVSRQQGLAR